MSEHDKSEGMPGRAPGGSRVGRRDFLRGAAVVPLVGLGGRGASAANPGQGGGAGTPSYPGMIVRQSSPPNLEFPFADLDGFITPTERFYVRSHFPVPTLDTKTWRLAVGGAVERTLELDDAEIRKMPSRTITAMMECAGNGRVLLSPRAKGLLWEQGGVGNAEWTGVPLGAVLERAGVKADAVEVVLEGADEGEIRDDPATPGVIKFARSVPLDKARADVLLAYKMNGEDLTRNHGYPLRAVVPGWYGMASVKWLARIVVVDRPFGGYFQTFDYSTFERRDGMASLVPLRENTVKAQIARPARYEVVRRDQDYRVFGAAWAGESDVAKVEISQDRGQTWTEAKLLGENVRHAWRLWEWAWRTPKQPGTGVLMARATDKLGRTQPMTRDTDRRSVMISHVAPVEFEVV